MQCKRGKCAAILLVLGVAHGCTAFGGYSVPIRIESDPPKAAAYLIPLYKWDREGAKIIGVASALAAFRVGGDAVTPLHAVAPATEHMLLLRLDGKTLTHQVTPFRGAIYKLHFNP